jgi:hypothetical protein
MFTSDSGSDQMSDPATVREQRRRDAAWQYRRHVLGLLDRRADLEGVSKLADLIADSTRWAA